MKNIAVGLVMILGLSVITTQAQAKGCLKGAIVGAVVGHLAHHHAVLGAIGGCLVGRHLAKEKDHKEAPSQGAPAAHH